MKWEWDLVKITLKLENQIEELKKKKASHLLYKLSCENEYKTNYISLPYRDQARGSGTETEVTTADSRPARFPYPPSWLPKRDDLQSDRGSLVLKMADQQNGKSLGPWNTQLEESCPSKNSSRLLHK